MASNPTLWAATPDDVQALPRNAVHDMIERLIGWLDESDGDPDLEEEGIEDDFQGHVGRHGLIAAAGCPVSDPPEDSDEDSCLAGDDAVFSGAVMGGGAYYQPRPSEAIGSDEDAEENGDLELNGDEGDYGGEVDGV